MNNRPCGPTDLGVLLYVSRCRAIDPTNAVTLTLRFAKVPALAAGAVTLQLLVTDPLGDTTAEPLRDTMTVRA